MHNIDVAEGSAHCMATGLNNQGNLPPPPPGRCVCGLDIWAQAQGIEAKAGSTVSGNSNSRDWSFPQGVPGREVAAGNPAFPNSASYLGQF